MTTPPGTWAYQDICISPMEALIHGSTAAAITGIIFLLGWGAARAGRFLFDLTKSFKRRRLQDHESQDNEIPPR